MLGFLTSFQFSLKKLYFIDNKNISKSFGIWTQNLQAKSMYPTNALSKIKMFSCSNSFYTNTYILRTSTEILGQTTVVARILKKIKTIFDRACSETSKCYKK